MSIRMRILNIVTNVLITGILLCIFAFMHHILPRLNPTVGDQEGIRTIGRPTLIAYTPSPTAIPTATPTHNTPPPGQTATPSPVPTVPPTPTPYKTEWQIRFSDKFSSTVIKTDNSYKSPTISIDLKTIQTGSGSNKVTYHFADIYIADISCLRTAFAKGKYGGMITDTVLNTDISNDAIIAVSGDSYGFHYRGDIIRNGVLYREGIINTDTAVLYYDGTFECIGKNNFNIDDIVAKGAYQTWFFGPSLLGLNGSPKTDFDTSSYITQTHPRSVIGYFEPGHYCFVVVDGRQSGYSVGLNIVDLSKLMNELGCKAAYNLDGGRIAAMTFYDKLYSRPSNNGGEISDIIYIGEINLDSLYG